MEAARRAASEVIDVFHDPRRNVDHAGDLQRSDRFKGEMVSLMQRAEAWATAELAAGYELDMDDGAASLAPKPLPFDLPL